MEYREVIRNVLTGTEMRALCPECGKSLPVQVIETPAGTPEAVVYCPECDVCLTPAHAAEAKASRR